MRDYIITKEGAGTRNWTPTIVRAQHERAALAAAHFADRVEDDLRKLPSLPLWRSESTWQTYRVMPLALYPWRGGRNKVPAVRINKAGEFVRGITL